MSQKYSYYCFVYFIALLLFATISLPSFDTFYYWDWSRHLDWSYYDGSPMIAYFIKLSTLVFGNSLFALGFVGIFTTALTSLVIFKTARLFLSKKASFIALYLWLFSPLVTLDLIKQTTYDTPLVLFWSLTLYFVIRFIKYEKQNDLYLIGASIGLMLLSKYSGVVLVLALLIFLIKTKYRYLLVTYPFYLSLLIALLIFTPVIYWNYQHDWISFKYQLSVHKLNEDANPLKAFFSTSILIILPALNAMLIPPFLKIPRQKSTNELILSLCKIICITFLGFYLFTAFKANIRLVWLTPYLVTAALLGGYFYQELKKSQKAWKIFIIIYAIVSICILINSTFIMNFIPSKKHAQYRLIKQFNESVQTMPEYIFTSGWEAARALFFVKNKPLVYTLDCGSLQNQYELWSKVILGKIADRRINNVLFIDLVDQSACLKKYFDRCEPLVTKTEKLYTVYAYKCFN